MIQRKQSLLLLLAAISTIILLFTNLATLTTNLHQFNYTAFTVKFIDPISTPILSTVYVALSLIVSTIISVVAIFQYKNRKRQQQVVSVNMIAILIVICLMTYIYPEFIFTNHTELHEADLRYLPTTFIIFIPALCLFFAKKLIAKDEALVNSADRLR